MKEIFAVMNTTRVVVKIRPEKKSGLNRIWTHDLCNTGAVLYQAPRWLVSSVGRALHRYRKGHGFESRTGLNFFQALFSLLLKQCSLLRRSLSYSCLYLQFKCMTFIYSHSFITILLRVHSLFLFKHRFSCIYVLKFIFEGRKLENCKRLLRLPL